MPPLGRQSSWHLDRAQAWIDRAQRASQRSRPGCGSALPHILAATEALAAAWEHIEAISTSTAKGDARTLELREKDRLSMERKKIARVVARDTEIYFTRCTRR